MDFENYIHHVKLVYFTEWAMLFAETMALIAAIVWARRYYLGRLFIFYIAFDLSIYVIDILLDACIKTHGKFSHRFIWTTNNIVAFIEVIVYGYFFYKVLSGKTVKRMIKILSVIYGTLILMYSITRLSFLTERFQYISIMVSVLEFFVLIPLCLLFYKDLLQGHSKIKLFERPSFWIATGIFFFSFLSLPYYLLYTLMKESKNEWRYVFDAGLFYFPYTMSFIFLIKAFLCKKSLTI